MPLGKPLTIDCARALPNGTLDNSTFEDVESALDAVMAPCMDRAGRWLTLPQRVHALAKELAEANSGGR